MSEEQNNDAPQEAGFGGESTRLFQISEPDLAELERLLPEFCAAAGMNINITRYRKQFEKAKEIISNVRWNYGPPRERKIVPMDDLDQEK